MGQPDDGYTDELNGAIGVVQRSLLRSVFRTGCKEVRGDVGVEATQEEGGKAKEEVGVDAKEVGAERTEGIGAESGKDVGVDVREGAVVELKEELGVAVKEEPESRGVRTSAPR